MRCRRLLPTANVIACVLFVLLLAPTSIEYLAELDGARASGGMSINSGFVGTVACRPLHSWSAFHGGEALGVKILDAANFPALVVTAGAGLFGEISVARLMSACRWSWLLAGVFLVLASAQWWLVGLALDRGRRRLRSPSRVWKA